jgi:hypothetical protein
VLDSNPGLLPKDKSDVALVMEKIGKIPMPLQSRDDMIAELQVPKTELHHQHVQHTCLVHH